jgi:hypothetical protein
MTDKLHFNGINGATGTYGLKPMTAEDFANHVLDERYAALRQIEALKASLERRFANDDKILDIVELLTQTLVDRLSAQAPPPATWAEDLALRLMRIVLDAASPAQPVQPLSTNLGDVQALAQRLRRAPVKTVRKLIRLLQRDQGAELAPWLLNVEDEGAVGLRGSLEARFEQALIGLRQTYLGDAAEPAVGEQGALRGDWVAALTWELEQLPVDAIRAVLDVDPVARSLATLVSSLRSLNDVLNSDSAGAVPPPLAGAVDHLASLERGVSWHRVVDGVRDLLAAISTQAVPVSWPELRDGLRAWLDELRRLSVGHLGTVPWVDPLKLEEAGWGVIFPAAMAEDRRAAIAAALEPLLALRRRQAGELFKHFAGGEGYRPGETADLFLRRKGADAASPADPGETGVPYYLLLIGDPEEIPFTFQYQLDVQYAVGRLDFGDRWEDYAHYAQNVVASEAPAFSHHPQAVFVGTRHPGDEATNLSADHLVASLRRHAEAHTTGTAWRVLDVAPEHATKANLTRMMRLDKPPAFLFAAAHGLEFDADDDRQRDHQGALLCQDWDGREGAVPLTVSLSARDIAEDMNLQGMLVFLFACYGAGTPRYDDYYRREFKEEGKVIAEKPFVAALPKAMLALRDRGALAVVGHVDRAWSLSFLSDVANRPEHMEQRKIEHVQAFAAAIDRLLAGHPVGSALDFLDMRYAAVATELASLYDTIADPPRRDEIYRLAELWTAHNDARGYVVLGDPAVRLRPPA